MANGPSEGTSRTVRRIEELEAVFRLVRKYPVLSILFGLGALAYLYFHHVRDPIGAGLDALDVRVEQHLDSLGAVMEERMDAIEIQVAKLGQQVQDMSDEPLSSGAGSPQRNP